MVMYHPFYCDENMFYLAREARFSGRRARVVFVSSASGAVAMWRQRAGRARDGLVVWDYHVILLDEDAREIWDYDTTLGAPVDGLEYLAASFLPGVPREHAPRFRLVDAPELVASFASDRSHMRDARGRFRRPPPPWPPIARPGCATNLARFVDTETAYLGEVIDLAAFRRRLKQPLSPREDS
jgi:hypothetical protein